MNTNKAFKAWIILNDDKKVVEYGKTCEHGIKLLHDNINLTLCRVEKESILDEYLDGYELMYHWYLPSEIASALGKTEDVFNDLLNEDYIDYSYEYGEKTTSEFTDVVTLIVGIVIKDNKGTHYIIEEKLDKFNELDTIILTDTEGNDWIITDKHDGTIAATKIVKE